MNKRSFKYGGGGPSKQNLKVDFEKEIMLGYSWTLEKVDLRTF